MANKFLEPVVTKTVKTRKSAKTIESIQRDIATLDNQINEIVIFLAQNKSNLTVDNQYTLRGQLLDIIRLKQNLRKE